MKKSDAAKIRAFDRDLKSEIERLGLLYKQKKLTVMAGLMGENSVIILLKSRRIYQGKAQILLFWQQMRAKGLKTVRFEVVKQVVKPADYLLAEPGQIGTYMAYDRMHYAFGKCELIFNSPKLIVDCAALRGHKVICIDGDIALFVNL